MTTNRVPVLFFALLVAACAREADDVDSTYTRYTGTAAWTIDGTRPGMTLDELKRRKGEPDGFSGSPPSSIYWGSPSNGLTVNVDAKGRINEVWGTTLKAGDETLLSAGVNDADVTAVLGKSDAKSMTQPGSFVLPTPGKNVGTQHVYRNGDVRFRLIVMKRGGLTGITAEKN